MYVPEMLIKKPKKSILKACVSCQALYKGKSDVCKPCNYDRMAERARLRQRGKKV